MTTEAEDQTEKAEDGFPGRGAGRGGVPPAIGRGGKPPGAAEAEGRAADGPPDTVEEMAAAQAAEVAADEPAAEVAEPAAPEEAAAEAPPVALDAEGAMRIVESLLFASPVPLTLETAREASGLEAEAVRTALVVLGERYAEGKSGIVLTEVAGAWQLRTATSSALAVRRLLKVRPQRLTKAALETLALIAYRQPITRADVEEVRGVDCGAVLKALLERKLVKIMGKKDELGRPLLYGTTKEFLEFFGLSGLDQLPSLREFQELNEENRSIVDQQTAGNAEEHGDDAAPGVAAGHEQLCDPSGEATDEDPHQNSMILKHMLTSPAERPKEAWAALP